MAKEFVLASLHNTNLVIRYYQKQQAKPIYATALEILAKLKKEIKEADSIERLMLLEAHVRKAYSGCFESILERSGFSFEKKSRCFC